MLSEILKALLITSLAGTLLTAVITVARPITKKIFGYSWHYYIWLTVLVVMLSPAHFTLPQKTDITPVIATQTVQNVQPAGNVQIADNVVSVAQTEPKTDIWQTGTGFAKRIIDNRLNMLAYLWLTGVIMLLLLNLIGYIRLIIKMRKNSVVVSCPQIADFTRRKITVRIWENTSSPFMTGIFKPTLVLPARELTEEQLNNILRHEMTHFKRHDILYKWFVTIVKCLHWFNPVIWYVAKQINTECEISCDMAVTLEMDKTQEMSYIDTVLSLLPTKKAKQIPLTTQMASSKRVLKRRFEMIRNKRKTSKFVSALSAIIAVVMLGTTVFASGILSGLTADDYTIEITNNGEKMEFVNKPFIENGEVYVPLRETFEKTGRNQSNSNIVWDDGKIYISIAQNGSAGMYGIELGQEYMKTKDIQASEIYGTFSDTEFLLAIELEDVPLLRNSNTYVTIEDINYMLYGFLNIRNEDNSLYELTYNVYDKNGNPIDLSRNNLSIGTIMVNENNEVVFISGDLKEPENTVNGFFSAFSDSNFTLMKNYCTQRCISSYFRDGYVFGMTQAELVGNGIVEETDAEKFDFVKLVSVDMTPHEGSVFPPDTTTTTFYVILEKQPDGRYLIDEFATGI